MYLRYEAETKHVTALPTRTAVAGGHLRSRISVDKNAPPRDRTRVYLMGGSFNTIPPAIPPIPLNFTWHGTILPGSTGD